MLKPSSNFLTDRSKAVLILWNNFIICGLRLFWSYLYVLSVSCSLVVTCWVMADRLALLYVMFSCVLDTCRYGVLGQVWYLIVSNPDLCLLIYFLEYIDGFCK